MVRMIAVRQINNIAPNSQFYADEADAAYYESHVPMLAYRWRPQATYSTKVITPEAPQVSARGPFRNSADSDPEPAALATVRDSVRQASAMAEPGDTDPGGRRGPGRPRANR